MMEFAAVYVLMVLTIVLLFIINSLSDKLHESRLRVEDQKNALSLAQRMINSQADTIVVYQNQQKVPKDMPRLTVDWDLQDGTEKHF